MGSYNETCGISRLPILAGDEVKLFFLKRTYKKWYGTGDCYIDDQWSPFGFPLSGTYNDYGSIENVINDYNSNLLFKHLNALYKLVEKTDDSINWTEVVSNIEDKSEPGSLGIMFVLDSVYQDLIKIKVVATKSDSLGFMYTDFHKLLDDSMSEHYTALAEKIALFKAGGKESFIEMIYSTFPAHSIYSKFLEEKYDFNKYQLELIDSINNDIDFADDKIQAIYKGLKDIILIGDAMSCLRVPWSPQCGKGGQDSDVRFRKVLNKTINRICNKRISDGRDDGTSGQLDPYQKEHNIKEMKRRKLIAFS